MKHVIGFSGGADSQACAGWCLERFDPADVILLNADPGGNEHPLTTGFIRWYSDTVHPVTVVHPEVRDTAGKCTGAIAKQGLQPTDPLTFGMLAELHGIFPTHARQFCTTYLKLYPARRWIDEHFPPRIEDGIRLPNPAFERYIGVRRDESTDRIDAADREYDDFFGCWLNRPIAAWTKAQVFDYLKARGEEINPLYKLGFSRVGCAPCINARKEEIRLWAARFPEMIEKVRGWEQRTGKTFFSTIMTGGRYGFIDEVIEWAKTERGGRQYSLPLLEADVSSGVCMSKYGLCE